VAELTREAVEHVAVLARLGLTEDEKGRFRQQLGAILGYVAQLSEVDTGQLSNASSPLPLEDVMGDDEVLPSLDPGAVLANAPAHEAGYFRVPPVLDEQ
jgi:aspartyl-tRNA(Asn)/glutamyl-tRNA(Gln) amidotransferase subunit C